MKYFLIFQKTIQEKTGEINNSHRNYGYRCTDAAIANEGTSNITRFLTNIITLKKLLLIKEIDR